VNDDDRSSILSVKPRAPVFGGWSYNFCVGWLHDLKEFVRKTVKVPVVQGPPDMGYDKVSQCDHIATKKYWNVIVTKGQGKKPDVATRRLLHVIDRYFQGVAVRLTA
jgi:hypothetical protein